MAKGNKNKGRGKAKVGGVKGSRTKQLHASNSCCPVIRTKCNVRKVLLPKKDWDLNWSGGSVGEGDPTWKKTYGEQVVCSVNVGKTVRKNLSSEEMRKARDEFTKQQADRRCVPLVEEAK